MAIPRLRISGVDRRRPQLPINHGFAKAAGRMQISGPQLVKIAERSEICDGRRRHRRRLVGKLNIRVQSRFSQTPRVEIHRWSSDLARKARRYFGHAVRTSLLICSRRFGVAAVR